MNHILFLHIRSSPLLKYANQNNNFLDYLPIFFVLVTNAGRIHLTKNKKMFHRFLTIFIGICDAVFLL